MFVQPLPKVDQTQTDAPVRKNPEIEIPPPVDHMETAPLYDTEDEIETPRKRTRKSRRREGSTSRTRVTRSKKNRQIIDDPDWEAN